MNYPKTNILLIVIFAWISDGCTEQFDPSTDWQKFENERVMANRPQPRLTADGNIPVRPGGEVAQIDPIDKKYNTFCSTCHGVSGGGDGLAGAALDPKPRDFINWTENVDDSYIAKVIKEGGVAVGKSPLMAPWGGVLSDDIIDGLVKKIRSFRK